ncbi:hypothetical protein SNEBB_010622 [Seison nebaliae]|nr:hypothetical protein SNEBB_010622 [Seison nebaliae]
MKGLQLSTISIFCIITIYCPLSISLNVEDLSEIDLKNWNSIPNFIKELLPPSTREQHHICCITGYVKHQENKENKDYHNATTYTAATTKIVTETLKHKTGYVKCGVFNAGRCSTYEVKYKKKLIYELSTLIKANLITCPKKDLKCCKGYGYLFKSCVEFSTIMNNEVLTDLFIKYHESNPVFDLEV